MDVAISAVRCGLPGALRSSPPLGIQLSYSGDSYVVVLFHVYPEKGCSGMTRYLNVTCQQCMLSPYCRPSWNRSTCFLDESPSFTGFPRVFHGFSTGFPPLTQKLPLAPLARHRHSPGGGSAAGGREIDETTGQER